MGRIKSCVRRARARLAGGEERQGGFALIEVAIASAVLLTVLTGVGSLFGAELVTVGASGAEQTANGLLTQAMEEVRALPFAIVVNGLSSSDSTIATDSKIKTSGSGSSETYTFVPTGETIPVTTSTSTQEPFTPNHIQSKTIDGITFKVAVYPTIDTDESGFYRVTVIVSWSPSHNISSVSAQTLVYSPSGGCLTDTNHPFAAPCQPFFYAQGGVTSGGGITVSGTVNGLTLTNISLYDPVVSSVIQMEQSTSVLGNAETSEGILTALGLTSTVGGDSTSTEADNDPGTNNPVSQSGTTASQSGASPLTLGSLLSTGLSVIPGLLDSGTSVSTVAASASPACKDLGGSIQLTGAACSSNTVTQGSAAAALSGVLTALALPLASVSPSTTSSFAADYPSSGSSYCTTTSGDGCVHAAAQRSLGTVMLAGLPALSGITQPALWGLGNALLGCPTGNYMVALVGYSDTATAESGISAAAPSTSTGSSGKLCYWNGSAYAATSVSLGTSPTTLSIPTLSLSSLLGATSVTITPTLRFGTATTTQVTSTTGGIYCATACSASGVVTSPVTGSIEVKVVLLGVTLADLTISVDLGTVTVRTSYQAAP